jgi:hypothetical protein
MVCSLSASSFVSQALISLNLQHSMLAQHSAGHQQSKRCKNCARQLSQWRFNSPPPQCGTHHPVHPHPRPQELALTLLLLSVSCRYVQHVARPPARQIHPDKEIDTQNGTSHYSATLQGESINPSITHKHTRLCLWMWGLVCTHHPLHPHPRPQEPALILLLLNVSCRYVHGVARSLPNKTRRHQFMPMQTHGPAAAQNHQYYDTPPPPCSRSPCCC